MNPSPSLLSTKFFIPQPHSILIERSRLVERLAEGAQRALTLISAPAGFGKTTLLCEWNHARTPTRSGGSTRLAWLSLDDEDNDPDRFWLYLITALQRSGIDLDNTVLPALRVPQPPPIKTILTLLINALEQMEGEAILILDDYHLIHTQPIHDGLAYLVLHLPRQFHVILSTRTDPPLPLSRLRIQNQLIEIRAADLLFTSAEADRFLRESMGISISPDELAQLEARTEGWVAGLQLAALSIRSHPDPDRFVTHMAGSQRYILDYLVDEVVGRLPSHLQSFLEQTAVLDRLCGPLCDALLESRDSRSENRDSDDFQTPVLDPRPSQSILEYLEKANLFITPLDGERRWYRYHPLFAECLVARLEQSHPRLLPHLYRRASLWFEQQGLLEEALHYRFQTQDSQWAAELVERCIPAAMDQGYLAKTLRWKDQLPEEVITSRPKLCLLLARALAESGKIEPAEAYLQMIEMGLRKGILIETEAPHWMIAGIRSIITLAQGDSQLTLHYTRKALASLPKNEKAWYGLLILNQGYANFMAGNTQQAGEELEQAFELGIQSRNLQVFLSATAYLTNIRLLCLQTSLLEETCRRALQAITEMVGSSTVPVPALCSVYFALSKARIKRNDLPAAETYAMKALELANQSGSFNAILMSTYRLAEARMEQGRYQEGIEMLEEKINLFRHKGDLLRLPQAEAVLAQIHLKTGDFGSVEKWLAGLPSEAHAGSGYFSEIRNLIAMTLRRNQGRYTEALEIANRQLAVVQASGRAARVLELLAIRSTIYYHLGDPSKAMDDLLQGLILAEPDEDIRAFVNEGPLMRHMLQQIQTDPRVTSNPVLRDYIAFILSEFDKEPWAVAAQAGTGARNTPIRSSQDLLSPNERLIEPLTPRELDILRLMGRGASNQEIAELLIISLGTVKAHTNHIQGKLGTHNRTETVVRARELGLFEDK